MIITQDENFAEYFTLAQDEALTPRQNRIVGLRYGFASGEHFTLEQIGQEFGISRERIRQILQQSLHKIRSKVLILSYYHSETPASMEFAAIRTETCTLGFQ